MLVSELVNSNRFLVYERENLDVLLAEQALSADSKAKIRQELEELNSERATETHEIAQKRGSNQTIGYIGSIFFLPIVLATDSSVQAKEKIASIHEAKDKLYKLQSIKNCPYEGDF